MAEVGLDLEQPHPTQQVNRDNEKQNKRMVLFFLNFKRPLFWVVYQFEMPKLLPPSPRPSPLEGEGEPRQNPRPLGERVG